VSIARQAVLGALAPCTAVLVLAAPAQQDFILPGPGEDGAGAEPKRLSVDYVFIPFVFIGLVLVAVAAWIVTSVVRDRRMAHASEGGLPPLPTRRRHE